MAIDVDTDECQCDCHKTGATHTVACCDFCFDCHKHITKGRFLIHRVLHCPPSVLALALRQHTEDFEFVKKANEIVKPYRYTATLSRKLELIVEDIECVAPRQNVVLTIDTKGTFPGMRTLEKLCNEIAEATGVLVAQISFCLFSQPQEPHTE